MHGYVGTAWARDGYAARPTVTRTPTPAVPPPYVTRTRTPTRTPRATATPRRTPVSLVAPVTLTPTSDTVTIIWPDNPIVTTDHLDERHLLTVIWDPPGGGASSSDEIPFLVRNLAMVPAPTPTP